MKTLDKKKKYIVAGLVVALVAGGIGYSVYAYKGASAAPTQVQEQVELVPTTISITSPEFKETSTPVIVHITSKDKRIDYYHAIHAGSDDAKRATQAVELPVSDYSLEFIPSVTNTGGVLEVKPAEVKIGNHDTHAQVRPETNFTEAEHVTPEMYQEIADKTKAAIESGSVDDTLIGKSAEAITKQLTDNIAANETLTKEDTDKVVATTEKIKPVEKTHESAKTPAVVVAPVQGNTSTPSKPKDPNKPAEQKKPVETAPEKKKEKVWVVDKPAWEEKVLVKEAWDEKVLVEAGYYKKIWDERVIDNYTGQQFTSVEAWTDLDEKRSIEGRIEECRGYSVKKVVVDKKWIPDRYETKHHEAEYKTVYHDEIGHWEWK